MEMDGELHAPTAIVLVSINIKAGWPQSQYGRFRENTNFLSMLGIKSKFLSCPAHGLVTALTTLTWLPN
jgi:hypothetical protein